MSVCWPVDPCWSGVGPSCSDPDCRCSQVQGGCFELAPLGRDSSLHLPSRKGPDVRKPEDLTNPLVTRGGVDPHIPPQLGV